MKNRNCPNKDACWDYDASNCEGCAVGQKIEKLNRKIKRLQADKKHIKNKVAQECLQILYKHVELHCLTNAFSRGWNEAISTVIKEIIETYGVSMEEILNDDSSRAGKTQEVAS